MSNTINLATFEFDSTKLRKSLEEMRESLFKLKSAQDANASSSREMGKQHKGLIAEQARLKNENKTSTEEWKKNQKALEDLEEEQKKLFITQKTLAVQQSKINAEYTATTKIFKENSDANGVVLTATERMTIALDKEVNTVYAAAKSNKELKSIRDQINESTDAGKEAIEKLNARIDKNTDLIKKNVSEYEKQKMAIGDYSNQIKEALGDLNIFNGGIGVFISKSKEAGGASNLVSNSFKGIARGLWGMIKASLAFIATPIGAVVAVLALTLTTVVSAFKLMSSSMSRTEEGSDKLAKATAVFSGVLKVLFDIIKPLGKFIFDVMVYNLNLMASAANGAAKMLSKTLVFLGFKESAKAIDAYSGKVRIAVKNSTDLAQAEAYLVGVQREAKKTQLDYQKASEKLRQERDDTTKSIADRIKANDELGVSLEKQMQSELSIAKQALKVADLRIEASDKSSESLNAQAEAATRVSEIEERITGKQSEQLKARNSLLKEGQDKAKEAAEKSLAAALTRNKQELDLLIAQGGFRSKSLQEGLDFSIEISKKEIQNLDAELKAKKITQLEYKTAVLNIQTELSRQQAEVVADNAALELEEFIRLNKTKIDSEKGLTKQLVNEEIMRLKVIQEKRIEEQKVLLDQGLIIEQDYRRSLFAINDEFSQQESDINKRFRDKERADRELNRALEHQTELDRIGRNEAMKFEREKEIADFHYSERMLALEAERAAGLITETNYQLAKNAIESEGSEIRKKISESEFENKLKLASDTYVNLAELAGKETAAGKAFAVAQTIMDTYQSATSAFKSLSGIPIVGPALGTIAAAAAVKTGMDNVKKINQTKTPAMPKAARGAVFDIGGNRHSSGGTKFQGEDGTRFEAEKGEKLFVLNRRASAIISPLLSHVNQQFGGVSLSQKSNYLAKGGMVSSSNRMIQNSFSQTNNEQLTQAISQAVYAGSLTGSRSGSSQGTSKGFVTLSNNRTLQNNNQF